MSYQSNIFTAHAAEQRVVDSSTEWRQLLNTCVQMVDILNTLIRPNIVSNSNSHVRRRRDLTVELCRVGVGGVYLVLICLNA